MDKIVTITACLVSLQSLGDVCVVHKYTYQWIHADLYQLLSGYMLTFFSL